MSINPIVLSIPIFFTLIAIEWIADMRLHKGWYRTGDAFVNIGCGIVEQVTGLFAKVFTVGIYVWVYEAYRFTTLEVNWLNGILLYLGVDFFYYWAHRMSHEVNLFWIGHVIHHQSEDYNLSVALRQGALQKFFTSPFFLPLAFAGFSPEWFVYILAWNTLYQFWIHTESIKKMGVLEYVLNTPSHHRVHHGRDPKYIDKNHAGSLIIWDKMFGTFQAEEEHPHYGITKVTGTFNPLLAHWKPIEQLAQEMKPLRFIDKIKILFHAPGWMPKYAGGQQYAPEVPKDYQKYNPPLSKRDAYYLGGQTLAVLAFTGFFLNFNAYYTTPTVVLFTFIILTHLVFLGFAFDKGVNFNHEWIKWTITIVAIIATLGSSPLLAMALGTAAISMVLLLVFYKK